MTQSGVSHFYSVFGLAIGSSETIPSLEKARCCATADPDVTVTRGEVVRPPTTKFALEIEVGLDGESVVLEVEEVGRFEIAGTRTIVIDANPSATDAEVHAYLLGSVFGVLLHRRGLLPIHCNAVATDAGAVLFCGDSGAGKSTLAAFMQQRGHPLLTDDLCPVETFGDGAVIARAGIPRLKLGAASRELLGLDNVPSRAVPWTSDKVELGNDRLASGRHPVIGLYHLRERGDGRPAGIHRLRGTEVANAITANIYRRRVADLIGCAPAYMVATTIIARTVPVFTINRTWDLARFVEEAEMIEAHMLRLAASSETPLSAAG